jgi:hypothetical protein
MRYAVTVEPNDRLAHPEALVVHTNVEADGKDAALSDAELSYRLRYPAVGKLRAHVVRVHLGR